MSPALYDPFVVDEVTPVTVGGLASRTIAAFAPKELAAPGVARVSVPLLPTASFIVPPLSARAVVDW